MNIEDNQNIFHYKIINKIASGGMGDVYLAEDTKLNRQVALKFLASALAENINYKNQFIKEAQAAAQVEHPNIVTIYEILEYNNCPVIVMEYVEGETLQAILTREQLRIDTVIEITTQICSALTEAHKSNIIHRDIKSSNLLLDSKGQVRILDFGLARFGNELQIDTISNSSGTLEVMAPEQIQGGSLTPLSDLFSLGVVLYQLLSGKMPFHAEYEAAIKYAIVNEQPKPLQEFNSDISIDLVNVVTKLLEKNPSDRFQSADEVNIALSAVVTETNPEKNVKVGSRSIIGISTICLIAVALLYATYLFVDFKKNRPEEIMIAILPFDNLGVGEDEFFSDRMTDALTSYLAKIDNIGVISGQSAMLYKNSELSMPTIGDELGVNYLLVGTIHWDKNNSQKCIVYTKLIDVVNDIHVWTNQYNSNSEELFVLQSSISKEISQTLHLVLSEIDQKDLASLPTSNLEAYNLYLQGNKYFHRSWKKNDVDFAMQFYQKAIAIDSNFADAYAMLSRCYSSLYWDYYDHIDEICIKSKEFATKSIQLQANQTKGFEALGYYYYHCERNFDTALVIFSNGLDVDMNNSDLHNAVAAILRRLARFEESCENFKHAYKLDPRSHLKAVDVALTYGMMGQYDSSEIYAQKAIALAPDYSFGNIYYAWLPIIKNSNIKEAKIRLVKAREHADLTSSKYYWWLLRTLKIDALPKLTQITPGTDSIAYYLYTARSHRLNENFEKEKIYSDSVLKIVEEKMLIDSSDAKFNCSMGLAYAGVRNKEKAFYYGGKAMSLIESSKESFDAPFIVMDFAEIQMIFGENDTAIEWLTYLNDKSGFFSKNYFESDPLWQSLANEESFKKLLLKSKKN